MGTKCLQHLSYLPSDISANSIDISNIMIYNFRSIPLESIGNSMTVKMCHLPFPPFHEISQDLHQICIIL